MQFLVDANCLTQADLPGKPHLEFFVPPEISGEVDCYLAGSGLDKGTLIGINPCASYDYKRWSARRFAAVADYLVDTCGARILLFGSPSERPVVQQVMAAMRHPATDTSHLSLYQAFELIRRLRLFVTNDSAPMHIAAALGTPLVALHGPINVKKFAPLTDVGRGISIDLPCRPCKEIARCESRLCFDNVTVDDVCRVCDEVLTLSARVHS
jgi:ADP-heptose:LPS heptosyltransferase